MATSIKKEGRRIKEELYGLASEVVVRCYNSKFEETRCVYDIELKLEIENNNFERALRAKLVNQALHDGQKLLFQYACSNIIVFVKQILTTVPASSGLVTEETKLTATKFGQDEIFRPGINPRDFGKELHKLGIGGMETMFTKLIKSLFKLRCIPQDVRDSLKIDPSKGVLFHGPPRTGKTLLARNFCNIILSVTPRIIGPEIIKDIESNVRKILAPAQRDYQKYGSKSPLHVFIFDDFDSIAQKGIQNRRQILSMLREISALPNIMILATTSVKDLIDPDLLRAGCIKTLVLVDLATKDQRIEILRLKLKPYVDNNMTDEKELDLNRLAILTEGFTGADIQYMVETTLTRALEPHSFESLSRNEDTAKSITMNMGDFEAIISEMQAEKVNPSRSLVILTN